MILVACLDTVVTMAKALPVVLIPEEDLVSSVRNDMIHISSFNIPTFFQALHAQRMGFKVTLACFVPSAVVASASCGACFLWVEGTVFVTVLRAIGNKCCTAGVLARCVWSAWHWLRLLSTVGLHNARGGQSRLNKYMCCGRSELRPSHIVVGETKI